MRWALIPVAATLGGAAGQEGAWGGFVRGSGVAGSGAQPGRSDSAGLDAGLAGSHAPYAKGGVALAGTDSFHQFMPRYAGGVEAAVGSGA
eukprot:CAMPEP_0197934494 /NCGR_PEP_ID=MMETSP1439-20131203/111895_1 /TAXON_ID=66791 /ORGANISM="Gonyaulax spinifera, Strain CCMP409" /LENGTH=89 /DNA_ID=CAMNT_0043557397 /DNA_START=16 /DNA_END=282 /DNA_ORIENTATION=-